MAIKSKYDVVIIGAGVSGLICGAYLAKYGRKVLIVEKNHNPGGCCVSFMRNGFRFDAGAHIIGGCGVTGVMTRILRNLNIDQVFVKITPTDRFFFDGDVIEISDTVKEYIATLKKLFPKEKKIGDFFEKILTFSKRIQDIVSYESDITYQQLLDNYFEDKKIKAILSGQSGFLGISPSRASEKAMAAMMISYLVGGAYYPLGGASSISDKLAANFSSRGGDLLLRTSAKKLVIKNGNVTELLIEKDGELVSVKSDFFVSSIDAHMTMYNIIGREHIANDAIESINRSNPSQSLFALYLGTSLQKDVVDKNVGWHYRDYDVNDGLKDCYYISAPSLYDSKAAPDNKTTLEVFRMIDQMSGEHGKAKTDRLSYQKQTVSFLKTLFPSIESEILVKETAMPSTIEKYTGSYLGAAYGWGMECDQYRRNDIIDKNLFRNLFHTGQWTNPGGGILAVAISGYFIAKKVLAGNESARMASLEGKI